MAQHPCLAGCTQCLLTGRMCLGYKPCLTIIHHKPTDTTLRKTVSSKHSSGGVDEKCSNDGDRREAGMRPRWNSLASGSLSHGEMTALIAHHYIPKHESFLLSSGRCASLSRICGAWVEVLPRLDNPSRHYDILHAAMKALTLSLTTRGTSRMPDYLETYSSVLHAFHGALSTNSRFFAADLAAASMCLTLSEVRVILEKSTLSTFNEAHILTKCFS